MTDFYGSLHDPWIGDEKQSHRRKAVCVIWIGAPARNVTDKFDPYLISVRVMDGAGTPMCEIELDDRDARLDVPPQQAPIIVEMGWVNEQITRVFSGNISQVECGFGRKQGGRRMWLQCAGGNFISGTITSPMDNHLGNGADPGKEKGPQKTLRSFMEQVGKSNQGMNVKVHPDLAKLTKDYWGQSGESLVHLGQRIANHVGGTWRVVNDKEAELSKPGESVDGGWKATVDAVWGVNLIAYRVHPWIARSTWGGSKQQYFSHAKGVWKMLSKKFNLPEPLSQATSTFQPPLPAPNSSDGGQGNDGVAQGFWPGHGRVVINGEPNAVFQGRVNIVGARPGVDGLWLIQTAEHRYSRSGYVTWLEVTVDTSSMEMANKLSVFSQAYRDAWAPTPLPQPRPPEAPQLPTPTPTPLPTPEPRPGIEVPGGGAPII